jgi:hypothetical protein
LISGVARDVRFSIEKRRPELFDRFAHGFLLPGFTTSVPLAHIGQLSAG